MQPLHWRRAAHCKSPSVTGIMQQQIFMKLGGRMEHGRRNNPSYSHSDLDTFNNFSGNIAWVFAEACVLQSTFLAADNDEPARLFMSEIIEGL